MHFTSNERTALEGFLDWYRATLLHKGAGLTAGQLAHRTRQHAAPDGSADLVAQVRERLGAGRFDHVFASGARLSHRQAVAIVRDPAA